MSAKKAEWLDGEQCCSSHHAREHWLKIMEAYEQQVPRPFRQESTIHSITINDSYVFHVSGPADRSMKLAASDLPMLKEWIEETRNLSRRRSTATPILEHPGDWIHVDDYIARPSKVSQSARAHAWSELRSIHDDLEGFHRNAEGSCPIELDHGPTIHFAYANESAKTNVNASRYWLRREDIAHVDAYAKTLERPKAKSSWISLTKIVPIGFSEREIAKEFTKAYRKAKHDKNNPYEREFTLHGRSWHVADMGDHAYGMQLHIPQADVDNYKSLIRDRQQTQAMKENYRRSYFDNPLNKLQIIDHALPKEDDTFAARHQERSDVREKTKSSMALY